MTRLPLVQVEEKRLGEVVCVAENNARLDGLLTVIVSEEGIRKAQNAGHHVSREQQQRDLLPAA